MLGIKLAEVVVVGVCLVDSVCVYHVSCLLTCMSRVSVDVSVSCFVRLARFPFKKARPRAFGIHLGELARFCSDFCWICPVGALKSVGFRD